MNKITKNLLSLTLLLSFQKCLIGALVAPQKRKRIGEMSPTELQQEKERLQGLIREKKTEQQPIRDRMKPLEDRLAPLKGQLASLERSIKVLTENLEKTSRLLALEPEARAREQEKLEREAKLRRQQMAIAAEIRQRAGRRRIGLREMPEKEEEGEVEVERPPRRPVSPVGPPETRQPVRESIEDKQKQIERTEEILREKRGPVRDIQIKYVSERVEEIEKMGGKAVVTLERLRRALPTDIKRKLAPPRPAVPAPRIRRRPRGPRVPGTPIRRGHVKQASEIFGE